MSGNQVPIYMVGMIHTGEGVNIYTEYGANEFLKQCTNRDDFKFFSSDLKRAAAIRKKGKKKRKLNAADRNSLRDVYAKLQAIVERCDAALFRERVPDREITTWLSHAAATFQEIAKDPHWIRTGTVLRHDEMLFASCLYLFKHPVPVAKVFDDNNAFFESISAVVLARKGTYLDPPFAQTIEVTVGNILGCSMTRFDNPWPAEKTFKKLEASGILEHYMLCVAVKQPHEETETLKDFTLKYLLTCVAFIKKRFKAGTPCGDSLRASLDGSMVVCPRALPYLQSLLKLSNSIEESIEETNAPPNSHQVCHHCYKEDATQKLMYCSRCKRAYYCSKECQRAHWKIHRSACRPETKVPFKNAVATDKLIADYAQRHFVDIMVKMVEECEKEGGLNMRDMVLELDFVPDANGNVPVLQETPQFKIIPNSKYLQAQVDNGLICGKDIESFAAKLNDRTYSDLLCYSLFSEQATACCTFQFMDPYTKESMYTEEVLFAFRCALLHNNYGHLAHVFHKQDRWKHFAEKIEHLRSKR